MEFNIIYTFAFYNIYYHVILYINKYKLTIYNIY